MTPPRLRTCLWFAHGGEAIAEFYVSLMPESGIETISRPDPDGEALVIEFTLAGAPFMILNGGPAASPSAATSISVLCADQQELDRLWDRLTSDGGQEGPCGWLVDRHGVSWQIIPDCVPQMMMDADRHAAGRAHQAMMGMTRLNIDTLNAAFRGTTWE